MRRLPNSAGAFLWAFADEGVVRTDRNGRIDTWKNNAPDGILGPYREKEGSFYTIREIWSPVYVEAPANWDRFEGLLEVENRYLYTNLDQCAFNWALIRFPGPFDEEQKETVIDSNAIEGPSVAPAESGILDLPLPDT